MKNVYFAGSNCLTSIGKTTEENVSNILKNISGIKLYDDKTIYTEPVYLSKIKNQEFISNFIKAGFTKFESYALYSIKQALTENNNFKINDKTLFILSTTKGNIELLNTQKQSGFSKDRIFLWKSAELISAYFKLNNTPFVISNACISGVQAIILAMRLLQSGKYSNAIVSGADIITDFVVSGFMSFKSISKGACKPFDANRTGLSLGEGAGTILLTTSHNEAIKPEIKFIAGATANDANHISAPSRTADGLYNAITASIKNNTRIDYISAHGTATPYNDDMESVAIKRTNLQNVPVNSLKSYFGHSLGATGVIETALAIYSAQNNIAFKTLGFETPGTIEKINVLNKHKNIEINNVLKIASGFGGSNAALLFSKNK